MPHDPYMPNIINIFDNVACLFTDSGDHFILGGDVDGYNNFDSSHVGKNVAYLARNIFDDGSVEFESGIGSVQTQGSNNIITRDSIVSSSSSNNIVIFSTAGTKILYIVPNENNYQLAFNNFVSHSGNFDIENYRSSYLIDLNNSNISGSLPSSTYFNAGLLLDFRTINPSNDLYIVPSGSQTIDGSSNLVMSSEDHKQLLSTGSGWITLEQEIVLQTGVPQGDTYSLQYNDGNYGFQGSDIFTNNDGDLLIGDFNNPTNIIKNSGTTEFNIANYDSDFIVHGSAGKNLFFDADGKVGINMPSGYVPQVPLHVLQNACVESIRVENTHPTNQTTLTLYHKPSTIPSLNDIPSKINLAGKNSVSNQINYAVLYSEILSSTSQSTVGSFKVDTDINGSSNNVLNLSKYNSIFGLDNSYDMFNSIFGSDNTINGSGNLVCGNNVSYSGVDTTIIGRGNSLFKIQDDSVAVSVNGNELITLNNSDISFSGTVSVNQLNPSGVSVYYDSVIVPESVPSGQLLISNSGTIAVSEYNLNSYVVGSTSGLLIKTEDPSPSGLSDIYINSSGLNIDSDLVLNNLSANTLLYNDSSSKLSSYNDIVLSTNAIIFDKNIKLNTSNSYSVNSTEVDFYTEGYIATSGLVVDPTTTAVSGTVLTNVGDGLCRWQEMQDITGINVTKYEKRAATINSLQITIDEAINSSEFISGDNIAFETENGTFYSVVDSISVGANNTIIIVDSVFATSDTVGYVYSTTRGGYLDINIDNDSTYGSTANILSIRPEMSTEFNTRNYDIDFGVKTQATNYALYINSNYSDNTEDKSQVVINGSIPYNISGTTYADLTVNGYLYANDLKVSDNIYIDCGIVAFSGVQ